MEMVGKMWEIILYIIWVICISYITTLCLQSIKKNITKVQIQYMDKGLWMPDHNNPVCLLNIPVQI